MFDVWTKVFKMSLFFVYRVDCSEPPIFPWDRRYIARLTINGGLLTLLQDGSPEGKALDLDDLTEKLGCVNSLYIGRITWKSVIGSSHSQQTRSAGNVFVNVIARLFSFLDRQSAALAKRRKGKQR